MKTQIKKTMKTKSVIMLLMSLLIMGACTSTTSDQDQAATESKVKPPSTDIFTATFTGNLSAVEQHIKAGTDLNQKDQYGSSPLIIASTFGKTEVAKALIEGGADLSTTNNDGSTPLHNAAFFCYTEIVEVLLANGANKTIKNNYGSTPLDNVSGPFEQVKPIYDQISKDLGPLGFKLDYDKVKETRPKIAELLK